MTDETDAELMAAVCNGDQKAYQTLVRQHLKPISHYAYRLLGSDKDSEDIAQETFLRLWSNARQWQPNKARLSTWLHRITHNLCIDYLRKQGRIDTESEREQAIADTPAENGTGNRMDDATTHETDKRMTLMLKAMKTLPEAQRSALMLCHYSGFSNREAAAIMDISVKALESALMRGRRKLRVLLNDRG